MAEKRLWTMREMLSWCEGYLARRGDEHARLSSEWIIAHALGKERIELYLDMDRPFTPDELSVLRELVRRRGSGEPLQYLTGKAAFRYLELAVDSRALIPRPETEVLVSEALAYIDTLESGKVRICDVGTGSGCIACSLAFERPACHVVALDVSPDACELARSNVESLGLADRVEVLESDMGSALDSDFTFDVIVSNPPYIPTAVYEGLAAEVRDFEPKLALESGADGLDAFRGLLPFARDALVPGGLLAVELFEGHMDKAASLAAECGFTKIDQVKDLAGKPRVLCAYKEEDQQC